MMNRLKVPINNLFCAGCVSNIERVMRQQDGVVWAMVNFAAGEAVVIYDPVTFRIHRFMQAMRQLGYPVEFCEEPASQLHTKRIKPKLFDWMHQSFQAVTRSVLNGRMSSGAIRNTSQPDF